MVRPLRLGPPLLEPNGSITDISKFGKEPYFFFLFSNFPLFFILSPFFFLPFFFLSFFSLLFSLFLIEKQGGRAAPPPHAPPLPLWRFAALYNL